MCYIVPSILLSLCYQTNGKGFGKRKNHRNQFPRSEKRKTRTQEEKKKPAKGL